MKMSKLENLIAGHAYWTDKKAELKAQSSKEYHLCDRVNQFDYDGHCFNKAHEHWQAEIEMAQEEQSYGQPYFDDSFDEIEPCDHCIKSRSIKAEKVKASRRLGQIRSAITRVGRKLEYTDNTQFFGEDCK